MFSARVKLADGAARAHDRSEAKMGVKSLTSDEN